MSRSPEDAEAVDTYFSLWWKWLRAAAAAGGLRKPEWRRRLPEPPVAALQAAALHHPNARVRRDCLTVLDHDANDMSVGVFRSALADPVPRVREIALHGLTCERCRTTELCAADVTPDLVRALEDDPSPKVRHATVGILLRLSSRDARASDALARAARLDEDPLVRQVALAASEGRHRDIRSRKALRRRARRPAASHAPQR